MMLYSLFAADYQPLAVPLLLVRIIQHLQSAVVSAIARHSLAAVAAAGAAVELSGSAAAKCMPAVVAVAGTIPSLLPV